MDKKKILITDDEAHIRLLVRNILAKDYIILEASDGEEAVDMARTQRPDLILMDILMPKTDGYTACSAIKTNQATKGIPVVMLTGLRKIKLIRYICYMLASGNARRSWKYRLS